MDATAFTFISFESQGKGSHYKALSFRQTSMDVDLLSILFKYRPPVQGFPNQFTTHMNDAVYLGYRNDIYRLDFKTDPLGKHTRGSNHYIMLLP